MRASNEADRPQRLTRDQAREALPDELRPTFDLLCNEFVAWTRHYYGQSMVSYAVVKELVADGWRKQST